MNEWIKNLAVPFGTVIISVLLSYFLWGKRANEYNEILIEKENQEKEDNLKAKVFGKITRLAETNYLQISNEGNNTAYNIRFNKLESKFVEFPDAKNEFPLKELKENDSITTLAFNRQSGSKSKVKIELIWDDDYKKNRKKVQNLLV